MSRKKEKRKMNRGKGTVGTLSSLTNIFIWECQKERDKEGKKKNF